MNGALAAKPTQPRRIARLGLIPVARGRRRKAQAEEMIDLPIKTTLPYLGGNFALANNLNQPITIKYPTDTASIIFKETAADMVELARRLHSQRT